MFIFNNELNSSMKIKMYLDTNTVMDFFVNAVKYLKREEELKIPKKYQFMVNKVEDIDFVTSLLTKAEIVRELLSAFDLKEKEINELWNGFIKSLNCKYVGEFKLDERLVEVVMKFRMKLRTVVNFQHLFIAMNENAFLLTGDKDLVRIVRGNKLYDKIITYPELRKMFD